MTVRPSIVRLLRPRSIAVAGASAKKKSLANIVLDNLARYGFAGALHVIHHKEAQIEGRPTVASVDELPEGVDCVVLAMPAKAILPAVEACAAKGVGGIIIFSAGFAELGEDGRQAQERIREIAHAAGMVVEGPNCLGMMNYVDAIHLSFSATDQRDIAGPGIGVISQSGAMAVVVRGAFHGRERDVSYAISTGNEAANGIEDFLEFLLDDDDTRVICMIAEQLRDPQRFLALAGRARHIGKPIVMLHPGKSGAAREAARTHTGALAGDNAVMRAKAQAKGVTLVDTIEQLIDVTEFVQLYGFPSAPGLGVIGESGALSAQLLDYCEEQHVPLPHPEGAVAEALAAIAPGFINATNPLDLTAQAMINPDIYRQAVAALEVDDRIGTIMFGISLTSRTMAKRKLPPLLEILRAYRPSKPVIFAMVGDDAEIGQELIGQMRDLGIPFYRSPERVVRALPVLTAPRSGAEARRLPAPAAADLPEGTLSEAQSKTLLAEAGLPVPPFRAAGSADEAAAAAADLGYPVAMKVLSAALPHKSDVGGVFLSLKDEAALRAAYEELHANIARLAPGVTSEGVLIEPMARMGVELIAGARDDPLWGPVVLVGLGGVQAELLKDLRLLSADCSEAEVIAALEGLNGAALLKGFRGAPPCDLPAIARAVCALGDFAAAHPQVAEVEINPLFAYPEGDGVCAVDALISVRKEQE
ncbi:acetate--CoA ligase family protein [Antarcticimicrobium luteum]|uniref:CoA-binding protein n=1 Tax=Antarcticimicrobium luteum TaxID=2547397 RepID=A0A4R5V1J1_9RHOB|nr:acetate--CoA ligase family protein [Antarcticimicrobium luteum]TDK45658.1 CoA-binding protein [Antarcticimicrobium luteum]